MEIWSQPGCQLELTIIKGYTNKEIFEQFPDFLSVCYCAAAAIAAAPQSCPAVEDRAGHDCRQAQILLWPGAEQRRRSSHAKRSRFRQLILDRVILSLKVDGCYCRRHRAADATLCYYRAVRHRGIQEQCGCAF